MEKRLDFKCSSCGEEFVFLNGVEKSSKDKDAINAAIVDYSESFKNEINEAINKEGFIEAIAMFHPKFCSKCNVIVQGISVSSVYKNGKISIIESECPYCSSELKKIDYKFLKCPNCKKGLLKVKEVD
ncbi:hypothetical protein [Lachnobacterium bovis]|uniref:hypothetical protein n=1 Tax=Lachnobacterium bovis TaxID=140626 RepID=UPI00048CD607|nr:hypothetical protein [Lachnobacterium bovis]